MCLPSIAIKKEKKNKEGKQYSIEFLVHFHDNLLHFLAFLQQQQKENASICGKDKTLPMYIHNTNFRVYLYKKEFSRLMRAKMENRKIYTILSRFTLSFILSL